MAELNLIPEFTSDEGNAGVQTPEITQETVVEKKETLSEAATEVKPAQGGDDTDKLKAAKEAELRELEVKVSGLKEAKNELIKDLGDLRGTKRDLKKQEIVEVQ